MLLILNDDMGYSDIGCYGGEVRTPNLDRLAAGGMRMTQFYNTARCCPSRASLLTGLHPHQAGVGLMADTDGPDGYEGTLAQNTVTLAEVLGAGGYRTYMSGKWHVVCDVHTANHAWPRQRGFERFYGTIIGAGSYFDPNTLVRDNENIEREARRDGFYYTDAISDNAVAFLRDHAAAHRDEPFFLYTAYTAPHWPLHAKDEDIARYAGRFDAGWDTLRRQRMRRMTDMGLLDPAWELSPRDPGQPPWADAEHKQWQARRMEVYAAQIDCMDQGIGRILAALEETGQLDNTLVVFLADNGGCAEEIHPAGCGWLKQHVARERTRDGREVRFGNVPEITPGGEDTYTSYGVPWANLSNTPFRFYKHWVHEGGIATPLIAHWPAGLGGGGQLRHQPAYLPDVMPTLLELCGADYPARREGLDVPPPEGASILPILEDDTPIERQMFWEHEGNAAVREGRWKLVRNFTGRPSASARPQPGHRGPWELYDIDRDRTELHDLAAEQPERVAAMVGAYEAWAARCGVMDRDALLEALRNRR